VDEPTTRCSSCEAEAEDGFLRTGEGRVRWAPGLAGEGADAQQLTTWRRSYLPAVRCETCRTVCLSY